MHQQQQQQQKASRRLWNQAVVGRDEGRFFISAGDHHAVRACVCVCARARVAEAWEKTKRKNLSCEYTLPTVLEIFWGGGQWWWCLY